MTESKGVFDEIDDDIEARAIAEAEAEIDAGHGVPHAKVREWLLKLARGEMIPPPCK
ncbi:MAG: CopG family transcriptional regulator [Stellaceae bacterium]|jgi:predicted transcriptional regulator